MNIIIIKFSYYVSPFLQDVAHLDVSLRLQIFFLLSYGKCEPTVLARLSKKAKNVPYLQLTSYHSSCHLIFAHIVHRGGKGRVSASEYAQPCALS